MSWIEKIGGASGPATRKQLRSFGLLVGGIFLLIGLWPIVRGSQPRTWATILGIVLIGPGLVAPQILAPAYTVWMGIAHVLGWINARIIMSIVYFIVFTPIAIFLRVMHKTPIRLGFDRSLSTYRVNREARLSSHMKNQF